jgi:hypothetical protein
MRRRGGLWQLLRLLTVFNLPWPLYNNRSNLPVLLYITFIFIEVALLANWNVEVCHFRGMEPIKM